MPKPSLADQRLHKRLRAAMTYDAETGKFVAHRATTRRKEGARIGTIREDGSYIVSFEGKLYTASRLAHFWVTGRWPAGPVKLLQKRRRITDYRWANLEVQASSV